MAAIQPRLETSLPHAVPRLLVELPSRPRLFFSNVHALVSRAQFSLLQLDCPPGEFWPDVFVMRSLPWGRFLESAVLHVAAAVLLVAFTRLFAVPQRVVAVPIFEHSQLVYYSASDLLPPLDTRDAPSEQAQNADPEFSRQPIISVPHEADNRVQTIVTPPAIKLKRDIVLPNMVAWADEMQPRLAVPDAPLTPAGEIRRMPRMENSVVRPPPDAARVNQSRYAPALQNTVVAPPPELQGSNSSLAFQGLQPALIAPPPNVQSSVRTIGEMEIAPSAVIAPAPRLPVAAQRAVPGARLGTAGASVVPPPPSVSSSIGSASSAGSRGRVIALNLRPAVGAHPADPAGNRRGTFAASPEGHAGASGVPGSTAAGHGTGKGATGSKKNDIPSGLYVGKSAGSPSSVAGDAASGQLAAAVNPNLMANARPAWTTNSPRDAESAAKLSEAEQAVFAGRKFYSLTLNMPNLNSAAGSWIIRFAELKRESDHTDGAAPAQEISQPMATKKVDPAYPIQLMRENVKGTVILYAVIHSDGRVGDVRVLRGVDERLDRYAAEALAQWKFQPATKRGSPVAVEATFQIPFHPTQVGTNF
jgi:TonB family protein